MHVCVSPDVSPPVLLELREVVKVTPGCIEAFRAGITRHAS